MNTPDPNSLPPEMVEILEALRDLLDAREGEPHDVTRDRVTHGYVTLAAFLATEGAHPQIPARMLRAHATRLADAARAAH